MKRYFVVCASLLIVFFFVQVSLFERNLCPRRTVLFVNVPYTGRGDRREGKGRGLKSPFGTPPRERKNVVVFQLKGFLKQRVRARW